MSWVQVAEGINMLWSVEVAATALLSSMPVAELSRAAMQPALEQSLRETFGHDCLRFQIRAASCMLLLQNLKEVAVLKGLLSREAAGQVSGVASLESALQQIASTDQYLVARCAMDISRAEVRETPPVSSHSNSQSILNA